MKKYFRSLATLLIFILILPIFSPEVGAQEETSAEEASFVQETISDLSIVGGMGLAGVVLGLSTLPFYEEPRDHYKNLLVGGALGIIAGVGLVAYLKATEGGISEGGYSKLAPDGSFSTTERYSWHQSATPDLRASSNELFLMSKQWSF